MAIEPGTGKYEGMVGAYICQGMEDGKRIVVNVGSGLSDEQRVELNVIGQVVEVKADAITKSRDKDEYSLRFPRFLRYRGFEAGEKM